MQQRSEAVTPIMDLEVTVHALERVLAKWLRKEMVSAETAETVGKALVKTLVPKPAPVKVTLPKAKARPTKRGRK